MSFPTHFTSPNPAYIPTPPSAPPTPTTALLSCVSCRARKIKCSKTQPTCTACQRSKIECVYPARTRLPRGKQGGFRARNAELSRRLNRLESLVGKLGVENTSLLDDSDPEIPGASSDNSFGMQQPRSISKTFGPSTPRASESVLTSDGTRYLCGDFWSSLGKEVDGLKQLLNEPSEDEEGTENNSPESYSGRKSSSEYGPTPFIFNSNLETRDLTKFHPPAPQMTLLCDTYFHRCDPLFKILHKPTIAQLFARAGNNLSEIGSAGDDALMFAMYFASVSSMSEEECLRYFREGKEKLLSRYKYATEIALANADFLNSMELAPLQSFCIYLACARAHCNNRDVWTLTALALRIAQALDLPRDGLGENFPPFEAEMRRRLFWQISLLDTRGSEDRGTWPMILKNSFTTRLPLNINDEDIDPGTEYEPEERPGLTDMTFCLITCGGSDIVRRLNYVPPTASDEELEAYVHETERFTQGLIECMESRCSSMPCGPERSDLQQLCWLVSQLIKNKTWLCCQYPLQTPRKAPRSDANREEILTTAIWILENEVTKKGNPQFLSQWNWYSKVFVQWHPLAVALVQLCSQTNGPIVERAWSVVEKIFDDIADTVADDRTGTLWKPIKRLLYKARAARAQALHNEMNIVPEVESDHNLYGNPQPVAVPALDNREGFPPPMTFGLPRPPGDGGQLMMQPDVTNEPSESYLPQAGALSLEQQERDAVNWADWCEFVNSTGDPNQAVQRNGGGNWNPQFGSGFWSFEPFL